MFSLLKVSELKAVFLEGEITLPPSCISVNMKQHTAAGEAEGGTLHRTNSVIWELFCQWYRPFLSLSRAMIRQQFPFFSPSQSSTLNLL